jgi:hypothetical protein
MIGAISADINYTDAIVRFQHGDGVARADLMPLFQITTGTVEDGMQHHGGSAKS